MATITTLPKSSTQQLSLGLSWLGADESRLATQPAVGSWEEFLLRGRSLAGPKRLLWARLWPLPAIGSGIVALSGLMVWPNQSGVHLLLLLMVFWLLPLLLMIWTAVAGLLLGRAPWWRRLVTRHEDAVIALWFTRQSLLGQWLFCASGLVWLWLMLVTRQLIFYWSTSLQAVSSMVDEMMRGLSLGLLSAPPASTVAAAEAGNITGWESALLSDTYFWAIWVTEVLALWILAPLALLLLVCHWRLRRRLASWSRWNQSLRLRFERLSTPSVSYRALQPEQPLTESDGPLVPVVRRRLSAAGFIWQDPQLTSLSPTSVCLGAGSHREDEEAVKKLADSFNDWYVSSHTVPTGDLADLLLLHQSCDGKPQLHILAGEIDAGQLDALKHTWSIFLQRNSLSIELEINTWPIHSEKGGREQGDSGHGDCGHRDKEEGDGESGL